MYLLDEHTLSSDTDSELNRHQLALQLAAQEDFYADPFKFLFKIGDSEITMLVDDD